MARVALSQPQPASSVGVRCGRLMQRPVAMRSHMERKHWAELLGGNAMRRGWLMAICGSVILMLGSCAPAGKPAVKGAKAELATTRLTVVVDGEKSERADIEMVRLPAGKLTMVD